MVPKLTNVPVCKSFAVTVRGVELSVFANVTLITADPSTAEHSAVADCCVEKAN